MDVKKRCNRCMGVNKRHQQAISRLVQSQLIIGSHNLQTTRATLEACGFLSSEVLSL